MLLFQSKGLSIAQKASRCTVFFTTTTAAIEIICWLLLRDELFIGNLIPASDKRIQLSHTNRLENSSAFWCSFLKVKAYLFHKRLKRLQDARYSLPPLLRLKLFVASSSVMNYSWEILFRLLLYAQSTHVKTQ